MAVAEPLIWKVRTTDGSIVNAAAMAVIPSASKVADDKKVATASERSSPVKLNSAMGKKA